MNQQPTTNNQQNTDRVNGFTLPEILVVIAVLAILAGLGLASFKSFRDSVAVDAWAEEGLSLLSNARAKTLSSEDGSRHGVHFENDRMISFRGAEYIALDESNEEKLLPESVIISGINLAGGVPDIVFIKLTGEADAYGDITFSASADGLKTRTISIEKTGALRLEQE